MAFVAGSESLGGSFLRVVDCFEEDKNKRLPVIPVWTIIKLAQMIFKYVSTNTTPYESIERALA